MAQPTEEMRAELVQIFARFDVNNDGLIDQGEFAQVLQALGHPLEPPALEAQFQSIDTNGDGNIQFAEFCDWWLDYRGAV
ncbi:MAG: EF-hand domain-containing protein [Pseudomonadota bacterium]